MSQKVLFIETTSKVPKSRTKGYRWIYSVDKGVEGAETLPYDFVDTIDRFKSSGLARNALDRNYGRYINLQDEEEFRKIVGDKRADLIVKSEVTHALQRLIFSLLITKKLIREYKITEPIDLIPEEFPVELYEVLKSSEPELFEGVNIPQWHVRSLKIKQDWEVWFYRCAMRFYPAFIAIFMRKFSGGPKAKKSFKFGISLWSTYMDSICHFFMNTFFAQNCIDKNEALFVADHNISAEQWKRIEKEYPQSVNLQKLFKELSVRTYFVEIFPKAKNLAGQMLKASGKSFFLTKVYLKTLRDYLFWEIFFNRYELSEFLSMQEPGRTARVIFQNQYGVKNTFLYLSSTCIPLEIDGKNIQSMAYYNYLIHDRVVSTRLSIDFFKENYNFFGEYVDSGIALASVAHQTKSDEKLQEQILNECGIPREKIKICFCGTDLGRLGWFSDKEGGQMIRDIARLIEENEDYFLIYKEKQYYRTSYPKDSDIRDAVEYLISLDRVFYVDPETCQYKTHHFMGLSDLVISAFTSGTGFEAISAGIKSFFYAPNDRFNKNIFMMNHIPHFTSYGYEQLKQETAYWINRRSEDELDRFRDEHVRTKIDRFCDGKAINRVAELLNKAKT